MAEPIAAVLLDIEGTTTPIAFVHRTLFPFARARLPALLRDHAADPAVAAELDAVRAAAPGQDPLAVLLGWMDQDAKETSLKVLQGLLWRGGYAEGALQGEVYPDVAPALQQWSGVGLRLFVYSSGSVEAQKLIFGHSTAGNLVGLFTGFFDTRTGPKREARSYKAIADAAAVSPGALLFLSDVEAELDAAAAAGLPTCQLVRAQDGTVPSLRHSTATTLEEVGDRFALP